MSNNFDNAPADVMQVKNEQVDDDQIDDEEVEARAIFYNRPEVARSLYRYLKRTQPGLGLPKEESVARMNAVITMHCSYDLPPVEHPDILEVLVTILSPNVTLTNKKRMARITSKRIKDACQLGTAYMERAMAKFESSEDTARPTTPTEKPRRRRASLSPGTPTSRHRHKRPSTGCAGSFAASSDSPELRKSGDAVTDQNDSGHVRSDETAETGGRATEVGRDPIGFRFGNPVPVARNDDAHLESLPARQPAAYAMTQSRKERVPLVVTHKPRTTRGLTKDHDQNDSDKEIEPPSSQSTTGEIGQPKVTFGRQIGGTSRRYSVSASEAHDADRNLTSQVMPGRPNRLPCIPCLLRPGNEMTKDPCELVGCERKTCNVCDRGGIECEYPPAMIANDLEVIRQATESYYSEVEGNAGETSLEKASACVEVALADAREHLSTIWYNESLAAWNRSLAEDPEQLGAPGGVFTSAESSKQFKLAHMHKKNTSMSLETLHATTWWDVLVCEDEDFRCRLPMAMLIFERGELLDTPCRAPPGKPGFFKVAAALQDEDGKAASECSTCYAFGQTPCRAYRLSHRHLNALSSNQATKASDNTGNAE